MTRAPFALALVAALAACRALPAYPPEPPPIVTPPDRDGRGSALGGLCETLRAQSCPEGAPLKNGQTCFEHLTHLSARVTIPVTCLQGATTREAIRACGSESELRFACSEVQR